MDNTDSKLTDESMLKKKNDLLQQNVEEECFSKHYVPPKVSIEFFNFKIVCLYQKYNFYPRKMKTTACYLKQK